MGRLRGRTAQPASYHEADSDVEDASEASGEEGSPQQLTARQAPGQAGQAQGKKRAGGKEEDAPAARRQRCGLQSGRRAVGWKRRRQAPPAAPRRLSAPPAVGVSELFLS